MIILNDCTKILDEKIFLANHEATAANYEALGNKRMAKPYRDRINQYKAIKSSKKED